MAAVLQSDSIRHIYILFHILFHYDLSQDTEYSSPCYTVGPCCLSVLCISLNLLNLSSPSFPPTHPISLHLLILSSPSFPPTRPMY